MQSEYLHAKSRNRGFVIIWLYGRHALGHRFDVYELGCTSNHTVHNAHSCFTHFTQYEFVSDPKLLFFGSFRWTKEEGPTLIQDFNVVWDRQVDASAKPAATEDSWKWWASGWSPINQKKEKMSKSFSRFWQICTTDNNSYWNSRFAAWTQSTSQCKW